MSLTKAQILAKRTKPTAVTLPDGDEILLRPMTLRDLLMYEDLKQSAETQDLYPLAIRFSACDAEGDLLFGDEDLEGLKNLDLDLLLHIGKAVLKVNNLGKGDDEEQAKNS